MRWAAVFVLQWVVCRRRKEGPQGQGNEGQTSEAGSMRRSTRDPEQRCGGHEPGVPVQHASRRGSKVTHRRDLPRPQAEKRGRRIHERTGVVCDVGGGSGLVSVGMLLALLTAGSGAPTVGRSAQVRERLLRSVDARHRALLITQTVKRGSLIQEGEVKGMW